MNIKKKTKLRLSQVKYKRTPMFLKAILKGKYASMQVMFPDDEIVRQGVVKMLQEGRMKTYIYNKEVNPEDVETWIHYYHHSFKMEPIYV